MHVVVKLKNGEEVFGKMHINNEKSIELDDAMQMRYHISDETSSPVMYFTKYCIFTESFDITIPKDCIMHVFKDPVSSLIDFYEKELIDCKMSYNKQPEQLSQSELDLEKTKRKGRRRNDELIKAMFEKLKGDHEVH